MTKLELTIFQNYLVWLFNGDKNNAIVEAYNDYRRDNTSADELESFEYLPNDENTLNIILNDMDYLSSMFGYCEEEINEYLKSLRD